MGDDIFGGQSMIFAKRAVFNDPLIPNLANWFKNFVGIDDSLFYLHSLCQAMLTGLYTKWEQDSEYYKFKRCQNTTRTFENTVMS